MSKRLHLISLGCTKNLVDSEVMLGRLSEYRLTDTPDNADVIIINTCGFIDSAKQESIQTILEAHEVRKKDSLLVVSGCLSERYREELSQELPEVDLFTGVGDYVRIDELIAKKQSAFSPQVYLATDQDERVITGSSYHAYIKIAEGCNQQCSFCAIPSFKGKLQSRTIDSIVNEVEKLASQGFYDFSFISQDSSSYGRDLGLKEGLVDLIKAVEKIKGVQSARILYLYPSTTTFELIDTIADSSIFHTYFDMPIQHIDDGMLKIMKRGFGEEKTKALLAHMKSKPGAFVRTSVIAGHPGESKEAFERLCVFLEEFGFDRINVFRYSHEEGTTAYNMQTLDDTTVDMRIDELSKIARSSLEKSLDRFVNQTVDIVLEGQSEEHEYLLQARPLAWAPEIDGYVLINDTNDLKVEVGRSYRARITQKAGLDLLAELQEPLV